MRLDDPKSGVWSRVSGEFGWLVSSLRWSFSPLILVYLPESRVWSRQC